MSAPHRLRGVKVLKAVSSSLRLQILNLLFDKGPLSYTELMSALKMNPSREAGRFAYHLKFLLRADLIEADVEARKYLLTELGKMVIDVADRVEKKAFKPKGMLVRASRFALEEFDAGRIATSLIREAKMPAELAQKVAKEAEKRLLKSRTKYLTAPLVREIVNAILIEKGLEEYRHKLTRLGLPVHEVSMLVETKSMALQGAASVSEAAGEAVLKEYVLLRMFPRDIADAHLSGALHVNDLGQWTLKPSETMHDLRFFYQNGLNLERAGESKSSQSPPQSLESALYVTLNVLLHSSKEVTKAQTLDLFNVFLAPFVKGADPARIKEVLRPFVLSVGQHVETSVCLEFTVPDFLADKPAIGPSGKAVDEYGDLCEEMQLLASVILDILAEESVTRPLFNPRIIVKIRPEAFTNERARALLLKVHSLASNCGTVYFACLLEKDRWQSAVLGSGCRLGADLSGDWEIDTLRTGCLGTVAINLPRIAYECERDRAKFFEILRERLEMAARALEIKHNTLKKYKEGLLPFLMQTHNGDQYLRLESCSRLINLVGLKETAEAFYGKTIYQDEKALKLVEDIALCVSDFTHKSGRRRGKRLLSSMLPDFEASERLAQLDIDRYGFGKVRFSGTREKPFYSTISKLSIQDGQVSPDFLAFEQKSQGLRAGGGLAVIELGELERKPDELVSITKQAVDGCTLEFFTYSRRLTYCSNCRKSWFGSLNKCPLCGAVGTLAVYDRFASL
jgi:anaerobic ribonucleoside-triphosphate reductase